MRSWLYSSSLFCFGLWVFGCGDDAPEPQGDKPEGLYVSLSYSESDVTAIRFDVVGETDGCDALPVASELVALSSGEAAPLAGHAFASAQLVVAPGTYRVCATPLAGEKPSLDCAPTDAVATVTAEHSTEVMLVAQCLGDPSGGLTPVVSLNKPPRVQQVTADPSTYVTVCDTLELDALATDPEGDALSYAWAVLEGSSAAHLAGSDHTARFSAPAGDYLIGITVNDVHGGSTQFDFPVHVADAVCAVPSAVHDIFLAKCTPCHTTNATPSAGLSLATPELAYTNLVQHGSSSSTCSSRVRVIPQDPANSYVIAKLRGLAGICGQPMPRGRPPLPEEEIAAIEAWIADLPL
jgi:hypothetical protein